MQVGHYCGRLFCCVVESLYASYIRFCDKDLEVMEKSLPLRHNKGWPKGLLVEKQD